MEATVKKKRKDKGEAPVHGSRSRRDKELSCSNTVWDIFQQQVTVQLVKIRRNKGSPRPVVEGGENKWRSSPVPGSSIQGSSSTSRPNPNPLNPLSPPMLRLVRHDDQPQLRPTPAPVWYSPSPPPSEFRPSSPEPTAGPSNRLSRGHLLRPPPFPRPPSPPVNLPSPSRSRWSPIPIPSSSPTPEPPNPWEPLQEQPRSQLRFARSPRPPTPIPLPLSPPQRTCPPSPGSTRPRPEPPRCDGRTPTLSQAPTPCLPPPPYSLIERLVWPRPPSYSMSSH
ncbi:hypothetical protein FRC11_005952 [Ceratobasidium sp. 423]|nr:hypothetical protein FRC11_005952 [Ceratobasidium sp. 423]